MDQMDPKQLEMMIQHLADQYLLWLGGGAGLLASKDLIKNFVQGVMVMYGPDFNADDIVYISGRQARIIRVGLRKTVFYMSDRKTKMIVPNEQLKMLTIEKKLPKNGGPTYLEKNSGEDFHPIDK